MFRIRRIYDDVVPASREAIEQVQEILRAQFPLAPESEAAGLPEKLRNPLKYRFRSILFVADDSRGKVKGFALLLHAPDLRFCYLDFLSAATRRTGGGIGGALYERVREEALALKSVGIFCECLPDDPALSPDADVRAQNARRLAFYERYGARPIAGTAYETPLTPGDDNPPYLVFDPLGQEAPLRREPAKGIVRAILERKYGHLCPKSYVEMVVDSLRDDPVRIREPRYVKGEPVRPDAQVPADKRIALVLNAEHQIHHVRERGYVESPVRIRSIKKQLDASGLFEPVETKSWPDRHIEAVHDKDFVAYLKKICLEQERDRPLYPYVFPIRNATRPPKDLSVQAGYYCIDTFTPLQKNAWLAARKAADCALTGADEVLRGRRASYVLVRPPGHHAERRSFGGFCYLNSSAIAANYLSRHGRVAMLDIDYHHGNGQQDIFYERADVLTVSIHCHPRIAYPYFSGFAEEEGRGPGLGYNLNVPLGEHLDGDGWREGLKRALRRVKEYAPAFLVVPLGLDTAKGDPTGSWSLSAKDFELNGWMIGSLRLPTLVVQEGGYDSRVLGSNARHFFTGLWKGLHDVGQPKVPAKPGGKKETPRPVRAPAMEEAAKVVRAPSGAAGETVPRAPESGSDPV